MKEKLLDFYKQYSFEVNGISIGVGLSVLILIIGFFRTLFIFICAGLGFYVARRLRTDKDFLKNLWNKCIEIFRNKE